ncbi:hypothetical protein IAQ61_005999 [Plenodomus lingam]|uniref:uncharacterized protein n=1 Tax=Leptosphaeria maculans TaxID=5022 RepID=UPI003322D733|nr:hypothetical protein IAQ61_005999 [Plenodomus lingam]
MKTFMTVLALLGFLSLASGAQVRDTNTVAETPCEWCSNVYKGCQDRCSTINGCNDVCMQQACNSYINGKTCNVVCLWHC